MTINLLKAIKERHSVRSYLEKQISEDAKNSLDHFIDQCNQASNLSIQLILNEPQAFTSFLANYGKFSNVQNYIALIGKKNPDLDEKCGYYGQKIVLYAQQLGLNTCWVGLTYKKIADVLKIKKDEKLCCIIAIGYGTTQGNSHKIKTIDDVSLVKNNLEMPNWFKSGVEAALLAPTAVNQQKFKFILDNNKVIAKPGLGFYSKVDLGIAKYHFEIGADTKNFIWA